MEAAGYVVRQSWPGRGLGKALLVLGLAVVAYQAYKRWKQRRALSRLRGKVVLITGASSGLGEGELFVYLAASARLCQCSSRETVPWCGCKGHPGIT